MPLFGALLLMRQYAVETGHNLYLRCPAELVQPGGDAWSVRIEEEPSRSIVVTREAGAYQAAAARGRRLKLEAALSEKVKQAKTARAQVEAAPNDPLILSAARAQLREVEASRSLIEQEIAELSGDEAERPETWRFPVDLAGVEIAIGG